MQVVNQLLAHNDIDVSRVITLGAKLNPLMAAIYKNTDVGLFPSRCEGGTNLVMMEYMACGKPVIGAFHTGHTDILTDENSLPLRALTAIPIRNEKNEDVGTWYDSDVDELVAKLEWSYQNRDALRPLAQRAADDLARLTWSSTAQQFHQLLMRGAP